MDAGKKIIAKVYSYRSPQRYALERTLQAAMAQVHKEHPELSLEIVEIRDVQEILSITPVLILPSLVINDHLVCTGRFPRKEETADWLIASWKEMISG